MPYRDINRKRKQAREWRRKDRQRRLAAGEVFETFKVGHQVIGGPPRTDILARQAEIPADTRTLTAIMFGDPLPGRSAMDRRQA